MKKNHTSRWMNCLAIIAVLSFILSACSPAATQVAPTEPAVVQPTEEAVVQPTEEAVVQPTEEAVATATEEVKEEKQLIVARDFDLNTLDPHRAWEDTAQIVIKAMYDQLTGIDENDPMKVVPLLATEWTISEDGLTYTFKIMEGVKFTSGNTLTSEDVKFSMDRMKNLKGNPSFLLDGVTSVEAPDATTVVVTLAAPDASFLSKMSCQYMGIIDSKVAMEHGATSGEDAAETDTAQAWLDENSAGSGPFILDVWTRNQDIRFTANKDYWRGVPNVDTVIMRDLKDVTTQKQLLMQGDIDIAMNIDPDAAKELMGVPGVVIDQGRSFNQVYLGITASEAIHPVLATNQALRQAISYAIDYDGLINGVLAGNAEQPPSIVTLGFLGADKVEPMKRDLDKAKELMVEAGLPDGIDLEIYYPNTTLYGVDFNVVAQKLQADLAEVGIRITPVPQATSVWMPAYRATTLPFVIAYWAPDWMDTSTLVDSFATPTSLVSKRLAYVNEENAVLSAQALIETDPEKRAELYAQIIRNLQVDAHLIGMIQPKVVLAYRDNISNYRYHPAVTLDLYAVMKD